MLSKTEDIKSIIVSSVLGISITANLAFFLGGMVTKGVSEAETQIKSSILLQPLVNFPSGETKI